MEAQLKPTQQGIRGAVSSLCAILLMHRHACSINPTHACWILRDMKTTDAITITYFSSADSMVWYRLLQIQHAKLVCCSMSIKLFWEPNYGKVKNKYTQNKWVEPMKKKTYFYWKQVRKTTNASMLPKTEWGHVCSLCPPRILFRPFPLAPYFHPPEEEGGEVAGGDGGQGLLC